MMLLGNIWSEDISNEFKETGCFQDKKKIMGTGMNYINTSCIILSIIPIFETDEIKEVINYKVLISN